MKIELISQEQFKRLIEIQEKYPNLTYQQKGYDTPDKTNWSEHEHGAFKEVEGILKKHIVGFSSFTNFNITKEGRIKFRLQYDYGYDGNGLHFIGVGYIYLDELLNGFKED